MKEWHRQKEQLSDNTHLGIGNAGTKLSDWLSLCNGLMHVKYEGQCLTQCKCSTHLVVALLKHTAMKGTDQKLLITGSVQKMNWKREKREKGTLGGFSQAGCNAPFLVLLTLCLPLHNIKCN